MKTISKSLLTISSPVYVPLLIIISFLASESFCHENKITSCLTHHNINNFTLYSSNSKVYSDLLNFSILNLRFAGVSVRKPAAIVLPETKEQLANTVFCSRKGSFDIRVRSGGHSYEGSSSVSTDGTPFVLIDLMNLDQVSVDLESEVAWVEGGATLGQLYYAIAESSGVHGFPAGSCPSVGVGGQFSGGGFGFMSRKFGLAADNVVDALLVNAEGQILDREGMGEDVFWAIRGGGGGNWGIVYAWKIRLVKVPKIVTTCIVSRPDGTQYQVANLVNKWQHVAPMLDDEFHVLVAFGAGLPPTKGLSALFQGLYLGPRTEALSILNSSFPELGILEEDCKQMSWIESASYFSGLGGGRGSVADLKNRYMKAKAYFKAKSDYVQNPISSRGIGSILDILEKEPRGYVIFEPYGGFMERMSSESIAFPHRKGNVAIVEYVVLWNETENISGKSREYIDWIRGFYESMAPYVSSAPRAAYVNYIDLDLGVMDLIDSTNSSTSSEDMARVWGEKYFLKNYDRLVKAKTIIDPYNVFRHQQGIPPMSFYKGQQNRNADV